MRRVGQTKVTFAIKNFCETFECNNFKKFKGHYVQYKRHFFDEKLLNYKLALQSSEVLKKDGSERKNCTNLFVEPILIPLLLAKSNL